MDNLLYTAIALVYFVGVCATFKFFVTRAVNQCVVVFAFFAAPLWPLMPLYVLLVITYREVSYRVWAWRMARKDNSAQRSNNNA